MIQLGSIVKVTDKSGVVLGQCIKVLGPRKRKFAGIGDLVLISVKWINVKRLSFAKARIQRRYRKGTIHRAMVIRAKKNIERFSGVHIRFNENAVIIVTKRRIPVSNRVYGPFLREFCLRWP